MSETVFDYVGHGAESSKTQKSFFMSQAAIQSVGASVNLEGMRAGDLISANEAKILKRFIALSPDERIKACEEESNLFSETILVVLAKLNSTPAVLLITSLLDEVLGASFVFSRACFSLFLEHKELPFDPIKKQLQLINSHASTEPSDESLTALMLLIRVYARLLVVGNQFASVKRNYASFYEALVTYYVRWVCAQLKKESAAEVAVALSSLRVALRDAQVAIEFIENSGLGLLLVALKERKDDTQLLYYVLFSFWILSFHPEVASTRLADVPQLFFIFCEILRKEEVEKVRRVLLSFFRNVLSAPHAEKNAELCIDLGLHKIVNFLYTNKKFGDEDMNEDLRELKNLVADAYVQCSNWEKFKRELLSGKLSASNPCYSNDIFWKENSHLLEENSFRFLGELLQLIRHSSEPETLSLACVCVGYYVKFRPKGKMVIDKLDGKEDIMKLLSHKDEKVKKEALLCLQKVMVQNWEFM